MNKSFAAKSALLCLIFAAGAIAAIYFKTVLAYLSSISTDWWSALGSMAAGIGAIIVIPCTVLWSIHCRNKDDQAREQATLHEILFILNDNTGFTVGALINIANLCCEKSAFSLRKIQCNAGSVTDVNIERLTQLSRDRLKLVEGVIKLVRATHWIHGTMHIYNDLVDLLHKAPLRHKLEIYRECLNVLMYALDEAIGIINDFKAVYELALKEVNTSGTPILADMNKLSDLQQKAAAVSAIIKNIKLHPEMIRDQDGCPQFRLIENHLVIIYDVNRVEILSFEDITNPVKRNFTIAKNAFYGDEFIMLLQQTLNEFETMALRSYKPLNTQAMPEEAKTAEPEKAKKE